MRRCSKGGDVRGMCYICIGDYDDMTIREVKEVAWRCPQTPYAMAWLLHNNEHELWETLQNNKNQERKFREWICKKKIFALELIYDQMGEDKQEEFWNYINKMEKDESESESEDEEETVYDHNDASRLNEDGSCKGCNKCPKDEE